MKSGAVPVLIRDGSGTDQHIQSFKERQKSNVIFLPVLAKPTLFLHFTASIKFSLARLHMCSGSPDGAQSSFFIHHKLCCDLLVFDILFQYLLYYYLFQYLLVFDILYVPPSSEKDLKTPIWCYGLAFPVSTQALAL